MDALETVRAALRTHPEPASLPEGLDSIDALAEARNLFSQIASVANELRRLVDLELAETLGVNGAYRYGETILRVAKYGRQKALDQRDFWAYVAHHLPSVPDPAGFLAALVNADYVKKGGLDRLAALVGVSPRTLTETFFQSLPPTSPISAMPISKAPKWTHDLEEGEYRDFVPSVPRPSNDD